MCKQYPLNDFAIVASPVDDLAVVRGGASGIAVILLIERAILERSYIYCKKKFKDKTCD